MLVLFSLTAPIVIGLAALGTEGGYLYMRKTETQTAADMAALSAANALMSGNTGGVKLEAQAVAAASGYVNGQNGVTVAVNSPPSTGTRTSDNSAVEVIVTANVQPMLSKIAHPSDYKVVGRTVAAAGMAAGCALALNPAASWGISVGGTAAVDMSKCAIYSNSTTTSTFTSNGGGTLKAAVLAGSGAAIAGSGFTSGSTLLSQPAQSNPYANLTAPVTNFPPMRAARAARTRSRPMSTSIGSSIPAPIAAFQLAPTSRSSSTAAHIISSTMTSSSAVRGFPSTATAA